MSRSVAVLPIGSGVLASPGDGTLVQVPRASVPAKGWCSFVPALRQAP